MPAIPVIFYRQSDGRCPVLEWLQELLSEDRRGYANCVARIQQLADYGHELRRPAADYLQDGIYELRARHGHVQYRLLYFFHGRTAAVLSHSLIKRQAAVPAADIQRAVRRMQEFLRSPDAHSQEMET